MFQGGDQQMPRFFSAERPQDRQIVGFGAAARENDLEWFASRQQGQPLTGVFQGLGNRLGVRMFLSGQHEMCAPIGLHCLQDGRSHRRGAVEVEVDDGHRPVNLGAGDGRNATEFASKSADSGQFAGRNKQEKDLQAEKAAVFAVRTLD